MEAYSARSHSPRLHAPDPVTPVHSPHHSINSSTSSRTPLHTLTIHEYRKQQHTPTSHSATPPGKTLRRKTAASALNEAERVPLVTRTPLSRSRPSPLALHPSHSAHQLTSYQSLPPSPPHRDRQQGILDQTFRSQSAEPRAQGASGSGVLSSLSVHRVSNFKPIKRLPKPPSANGRAVPSPLAPMTSTRLPLSRLQTTSYSSAELQRESDTQTTPSTFSLSRFPQPPYAFDPSLSPPNDENEPLCLNPASFATTAPATPPATPAVIHYRGASFDLVNPHDSLLFHDVVSPSRDLDSSDYLPLRSSEDLLGSPEMAQKRPLYRDLSAAHSSITRRTKESPDALNTNSPFPTTPVARSPEYSSPAYSIQSSTNTPPLPPRPESDFRFSLKGIKRSLTKKLGRNAEPNREEELQDLPSPAYRTADQFDGGYPRSLTKSYQPAEIPSYIPIESPIESPVASPLQSPDISIEQGRFSMQRYKSAPLSSMLPEDPSTQLDRVADPRTSVSESDFINKGYYDTASIYASSSVYTRDGNASYQPSIASRRMSNAFSRYSTDAEAFLDNYNRDSMYGYPDSRRTSARYSRPLTQDYRRRSALQDVQSTHENTDTLSKLIDQYDGRDTTSSSLPTLNEEGIDHQVPALPGISTTKNPSDLQPPRLGRTLSGFSDFEFGLHDGDRGSRNDDYVVSPIQTGRARKATIIRNPGLPPSIAPPLAPPFDRDVDPNFYGRPDPSELFSGGSSYGDTRHLLHMSRPLAAEVVDSSAALPPVTAQALEPSSSYSQSEGQKSPHTPQEALDQADRIFGSIVAENRKGSIPVIWARRGSGNLLRSKQSDDMTPEIASQALRDPAEDERADWETVEHNSQAGRPSVEDSIADYSSSDGSRESVEFSNSGFLPRDHSDPFYSHPNPLPSHEHPFNSSPPVLATRASVRSAPYETHDNPQTSSPPQSTTVPLFRTPTRACEQHNTGRRSVADQPYAFVPFVNPPDPYALSDKETQELLNSGPNDDILYDDEPLPSQGYSSQPSIRAEPPTPSTKQANGLARENSFEKVSVIGPKGNLTGTPQGTGMHEVGSSIANTSSPGARLSSASSAQNRRSRYSGFYRSPDRTDSINKISRSSRLVIPSDSPHHERTASQSTLFPGLRDMQPVQENSSPLSGPSRYPVKTPSRPRLHSRSAVTGQTRLREMVLAPDVEVSSGHSTHVSRLVRSDISGRPSTSNTNTPLRTIASQTTLQQQIAKEHSPHLLCVERAVDPKDEEERRQKSWIIFGLFCILPPMLLLYRSMGDFIIINWTQGRLGHCSAKPKRIALGAGVAVTMTLCCGLLVPILVAHATGAL
ncbi:hypothetical protein BDV95DRAFT_500299 [Massariosphaeria phaeospora]|uniref:Uncharacterized protein n=1 Tax=Massariosphaeria phaeospora TaxID=100035 RepID=A0A7C8MB38_9PLEO|nr:hypothetical protein BDV95DRAFT_500299 [Massariosphaeria phaeospora]